MRLSSSKPCCLKHRSNKLIIKSEHPIQKLTVVNVVGLLVSVELHRVCHQLLFSYVFEDQELRVVLIVVVAGVTVLARIVIEEALTSRVSAAHGGIDSSVGDGGRPID